MNFILLFKKIAYYLLDLFSFLIYIFKHPMTLFCMNDLYSSIYVRIGGVLSDMALSGTPQGSFINTLLFPLHVNNLTADVGFSAVVV